MLEWQKSVPLQDQQSGDGPYPPLQRPCLVCGKQQWQWNGEYYECGSGDPVHEERPHWAWIYAGGGLPNEVKYAMGHEFVTIIYRRQTIGTYVCVVNSNISLQRGEDYYDMKMYLSRSRVYEQFTASPGDAIHIDVYGNDGESTDMMGDLQVTEQAIVVTSSGGNLHIQAIEDVLHR